LKQQGVAETIEIQMHNMIAENFILFLPLFFFDAAKVIIKNVQPGCKLSNACLPHFPQYPLMTGRSFAQYFEHFCITVVHGCADIWVDMVNVTGLPV
jgi:hypothetical protein